MIRLRASLVASPPSLDLIERKRLLTTKLGTSSKLLKKLRGLRPNRSHPRSFQTNKLKNCFYWHLFQRIYHPSLHLRNSSRRLLLRLKPPRRRNRSIYNDKYHHSRPFQLRLQPCPWKQQRVAQESPWPLQRLSTNQLYRKRRTALSLNRSLIYRRTRYRLESLLIGSWIC